MKDLPMCCGKNMKLKHETIKFLEVSCDACGDVVYLKKHAEVRPQLIDD